MNDVFAKIHHHLQLAQNIVIVPHQNPDGDALGSALALAQYLENNRKNVEVFCSTPVSTQQWYFLPRIHTVHTRAEVFQKPVDLIIVVDSGDLRYAGVDKHLSGHAATVINIDHHATNEKYGHVNLVDAHASSTCEVIYRFFKQRRLAITPTIATALLSGIITDTNNFSNSASTVMSLSAAGELLRLGGNLILVNNQTGKTKTLPALKLWGQALSRLNVHEPSGLVYTYLKQEDWEKYGATEAEADGIANFLNILQDSKLTLLLKEIGNGQVKGSLRAGRDDGDVSEIAKKLGGGGHKKAAGFTISGTVEEILERILTEIK